MLKLFNSKTHQKEEFKPIKENQVTYYGCGPTIYNYSHIGNMRSFIFYDVLNRYLRYLGYQVKFAMNLTDVDDKTIKNSMEQGKTLREFTDFYAEAFLKDCEAIRIKKPDYIIRATEEISAMIELIQLLLEKGYAYKGKNGDVFFKISAFSDYGKMAGIDREKLKNNADGRLADEYEKEDAQDFALWKAWVEGDGNNYWEAPFGKGRPGWSIECSAMARKYLGQPIDIHVGGIDLLFPHHTNEIAQSECAYGCEFVKYWIHGAHLIVNGKKMSKSLNNFFTLRDLFNKGYSPEAIRFEFLKAHYRAVLDFQEVNIKGNQTAISKLANLMNRLNEPLKGDGLPELEGIIHLTNQAFENAMNDDLNTPQALACLFDFVSLVNKNFDSLSPKDAEKIKNQLERFDSVLAILPKKPQEIVLSEEQKKLLDERELYRKEKQWDKADSIKKIFIEKGFSIKDTPKGPVITKS